VYSNRVIQGSFKRRIEQYCPNCNRIIGKFTVFVFDNNNSFEENINNLGV
jgi:hypothetical protein